MVQEVVIKPGRRAHGWVRRVLGGHHVGVGMLHVGRASCGSGGELSEQGSILHI